jgi:hypothetical protein
MGGCKDLVGPFLEFKISEGLNFYGDPETASHLFSGAVEAFKLCRPEIKGFFNIL